MRAREDPPPPHPCHLSVGRAACPSISLPVGLAYIARDTVDFALGLRRNYDVNTMPMAKISAVINTRNEERNLRECLETVRWCDEIVVVDMESEDRTVEIAREFTGRVFTHKKILAFDSARNFAVGKAEGDWILLVGALVLFLSVGVLYLVLPNEEIRSWRSTVVKDLYRGKFDI